ncbi:YdcF family protein [Chitinophaga tropicalis]|uniref:DUF218 domain-containing protein n=1 Tax=Chitinophaga tropicalis TaxID=2683588 RepID=A0A7K1UAF9_9BACT|nr:YdcF family protein [Chitinophaga tropicalis]MVT11278.1 hypothetical protein [Chitinophaga tropicalis]
MRRVVKGILIPALLLVSVVTTHAQRKKRPVKPKPRTTATAVISYTPTQQVQLRKSFYLLYILERKGAAHDLVVKNSVFGQLAKDRQARLSQALATCTDGSCIAEALEWSDADIRTAGNELQRLAIADNTIAQLVERLKIEARYPVYSKENDTAFIMRVWEDVTKGMNHIFNVYIAGLPPRYPKIDSISFSSRNPAFVQQVKTALQQTARTGTAFYSEPLMAALKALAINARDEATRYEPLYAGMNAGAFALSRNINWNAYRFTAIVVPGSGPSKSGQSLDSMAIFRCKLAAERFKKDVAPFIIVSGGHVHPYKTPYCEAIEMKKYLTGKLGIPDGAVIIEPHARHTTTNIRNAARLTYLYNMPSAKPMLIVSDSFQSLAIEKMGLRFMNELGYLPYKELERVSNTENAIIPDQRAWQQDPEDPLDP